MSGGRRVLFGGGGTGVIAIGKHRLNPMQDLRCAQYPAGGNRVMRCAHGRSLQAGHVNTLSRTSVDRAERPRRRHPSRSSPVCLFRHRAVEEKVLSHQSDREPKLRCRRRAGTGRHNPQPDRGMLPQYRRDQLFGEQFGRGGQQPDHHDPLQHSGIRADLGPGTLEFGQHSPRASSMSGRARSIPFRHGCARTGEHPVPVPACGFGVSPPAERDGGVRPRGSRSRRRPPQRVRSTA